MSDISLEVLKDLVPRSQKGLITEELVDKLNDINKNPLLVGSFKDNIISYISVLKSGKYKLDDYVNGVHFVSYKLLGDTDIDAYAKTFPERYDRLKKEGLSRDQIGPYVTAYKKNKLVVQIIEQTLVPDHIFNAPMRQQMLNELCDIALNGRSEIARVNAANSILTHTKAPETTKIELDIGVKETDAIAELREVTQQLAKQQKLAIESGVQSTSSIAESKVITKVSDDDVIDAEVT